MRKILSVCLFIFISFTGINSFAQKSGSSQFKRAFLERINNVRAAGCDCGTTHMPPAPPLAWNDNLEHSAKGHAWDMANNNYFSHTSKNGLSMEDRIVFAGYYFNGFKSFTVGENIAFGQSNIDIVMDEWLKSEGHCKNLMNPSFKEVGVAENHKYWVQDFGGRVSFTPEQQKLIRSGQLHVVQGKMQSHQD
jgi:uncharacterized protein YkwD